MKGSHHKINFRFVFKVQIIAALTAIFIINNVSSIDIAQHIRAV